MYDHQKEMVNNYVENKNNIVSTSRRTGVTAVTSAYILWFTIFNEYKTVMVAADKRDNAGDILERIRLSYENLPDWIRPNKVANNKHALEMDNGSRILSRATNAFSGRGLNISLLYWDNADFVRLQVQKDFWASVAPGLSISGECIISSKPNKPSGIFQSLWKGAEDGSNNFVPKRIHL
jgi:hypothetical protein